MIEVAQVSPGLQRLILLHDLYRAKHDHTHFELSVGNWQTMLGPMHPVVSAARHVHAAMRTGLRHADTAEAQKMHAERWRRMVDRVRMPATEDDPVPWDLGDLPLAGLTRRRARLVRDTLFGYPVRFWSVKERGRDGTPGVFLTIHLEGEYGSSITMPYDIVIATSWDERDSGPACGSGSSRVMGLGVLSQLDVLSMNAWNQCEQCMCWRPRHLLVDEAKWMLDDPQLHDEYYERLRCKPRSSNGWDYCA